VRTFFGASVLAKFLYQYSHASRSSVTRNRSIVQAFDNRSTESKLSVIAFGRYDASNTVLALVEIDLETTIVQSVV